MLRMDYKSTTVAISPRWHIRHAGRIRIYSTLPSVLNWLNLLHEFVVLEKMRASERVTSPPHAKILSSSIMTAHWYSFVEGMSGKDPKDSPFSVVSTVDR